jgi:pimeloyl-ACP methyl ester carboxylesterase
MTTHADSLPIIFIPGASSDDTVWDAQKNHFAQRRTALTVDLTRFDSISAMAAHVIAAAPAPEFIICGTSMGGYVGLEVLKQAGDRVKKAIFCNTSARADTPAKSKQRQADIDAGPDVYIEARKDPEHYKTFLSARSFENKDLIKSLHAVSLRVGYDCFKNHQTACATRESSVAFLPQINIPTLIIGGAEDQVTPPALQTEMQENIKGAQLLMLPQTGHIAHMEEADTVTAEIEKFLHAA